MSIRDEQDITRPPEEIAREILGSVVLVCTDPAGGRSKLEAEITRRLRRARREGGLRALAWAIEEWFGLAQPGITNAQAERAIERMRWLLERLKTDEPFVMPDDLDAVLPSLVPPRPAENEVASG